MDKKLIDILEILNQRNDWVSSKELSLLLGYSSSSIKNYVSTINKTNHQLIISSNNGYRINPDNKTNPFNYFYEVKETNLNDVDIRRNILLSKLLEKSEKSNIYDLCNDFYISVTTLKNDLLAINDFIRKYDLKIRQFSDEIELVGLERNKRSIFIDLVYAESESNIITFEKINDIFADIDVNALKELIEEQLSVHDIHCDDFTLLDILLHIALFVQRIKENYILSSNSSTIETEPIILSLTNQLAQAISKQYSITINESEIYELYLLILAKTSFYKQKQYTKHNIQTVVSHKTLLLVDDIIAFLSEFYKVDLYNEEYYIPFVLHIHQLLIRIDSGHFLKNPLIHNLKNEHPFIYQLSVSIVQIITQHTKKPVVDDEIGYLTLHLGGSFARQSKKHKKIITALIVPNNKAITVNLQNRIQTDFNDYLYIEHIFSHQNVDKVLSGFDLMISTIPLSTTLPTVIISPLYEMSDQMRILKKIEQINITSQFNKFTNIIHSVTDPNFFMKNTVLSNKLEVIDVVSDILLNAGYVNKEFKDNVIQRENLSSTAFNNIAIPHTFKMDALQSKLYVILSDKSILWDTNNVHIVFFFAINEQDKKIFYIIYEILSLIFSSQKNVIKALKCQNHEEFIELITNEDILYE